MQKNITVKLIAGIASAVIFAIMGCKSFISMFQDFACIVQGYGGFSLLFTDLIYMVGYIVLAAGILILGINKGDKRLGILAFAGACAVSLAELICFLSELTYERYAIWNYVGGGAFNFLTMLPVFCAFLAWAAFAFVAAIGTLDAFSAMKVKVKNLWFIPSAILLFSKILKVIGMMVYSDVWYGDGYNGFFARFASPAVLSFTGFIGTVFVLAAMCAAGILMLNPDMLVRPTGPVYQQQTGGTQAQNAGFQTDGTQTQNAGFQTDGTQAQASRSQGEARYYYTKPQMPEGYCDMVKHVLLLIFTFGIWQMIWIYRTTEFLNRTPQEPQRSGVCQLLLCIFVPFYIIYWVYASCKRIDKLSYYKGIQGEITVMCVILEIFIAILAPIFMQEKINNIVIFRRQSQGGPAPDYPGYQQPAEPATEPQAEPEPQTEPQAAPQAEPSVEPRSEENE